MKKIILLLFLASVWALGIYEGDCTAAVMVSIIPILAGLEIVIAAITWQIHKRKGETN